MRRNQDAPSLDKDHPVRIKLPTPETYLVICYEQYAPEPHSQARAAPETPPPKGEARATLDPRSQKDYSEKISAPQEKILSLRAELPA
jgi:hypothetical protein